MSNRRGQELPFSTIIIFILAILVLVLIIIVYWENILKGHRISKRTCKI